MEQPDVCCSNPECKFVCDKNSPDHIPMACTFCCQNLGRAASYIPCRENYGPRSRENYDPNQPVCNNQDDFNEAVNKAIKYNNNENMKKAKPWIYVYLVVWLIFLIWAIVLAMQIAPGHDRVVHLVFAIVFSPAYVLGYYLGAMSGSGGALMSMGSCGGGPRY